MALAKHIIFYQKGMLFHFHFICNFSRNTNQTAESSLEEDSPSFRFTFKCVYSRSSFSQLTQGVGSATYFFRNNIVFRRTCCSIIFSAQMKRLAKLNLCLITIIIKHTYHSSHTSMYILSYTIPLTFNNFKIVLMSLRCVGEVL